MKIEVNIEKKYFFSILAMLVVVIGIIGVYAAWDSSKTVWHSADDIKVSLNGDKTLQEAIDSLASSAGENERYHLNVPYTGSSVQIDQTTFERLCGDGDGCEVRFGYKNPPTYTQTFAKQFVLFYNSSDGHWSSSLAIDGTVGFTYGIDGDGAFAHIMNAIGQNICWFSDSEYTSGTWKDEVKKFSVLNWASAYGYPNTICELTIID